MEAEVCNQRFRKQDLVYPLDVLLLLRLAGTEVCEKIYRKNGGYRWQV